MSKELTPSMAPKLAECAVFVGASGASAAAERGTAIDKALRFAIDGDESHLQQLPIADQESAAWGIRTLHKLSGGEHVETREEYLAMAVPGLSKPGTSDALCKRKRWVADIKSGQVRNYRQQLAAYALACMEDHFAESWTAHVIYIDQRLVRSYDFTRSEAEQITQGWIAEATSEDAQPTPCEYCDWCANKDTCKALVVQSKSALADVASVNNDSLTMIRDRILADPQQHVDFVTRFKFFVKEFGDPLTDALRDRLEAGEMIDGWALTNPKEKQYIEPATALDVAGRLDPITAFLAGGGKMSAEKFLEFAQELQIENPHSLVKSAPGTKAMRQTKKKN